MSLHNIASHLAAHGRGKDSMLVHMTPKEVAGLQAVAKAHGGSLTINPETGLVEAGFLDSLAPAIIGGGISFLSGGTIDPFTAAAMVGGFETVRTGDVGKGLMAGLGAYGGASLTGGLMGEGFGSLAEGATAEGARAAGESALGQMTGPLSEAERAAYDKLVQEKTAEQLGSVSKWDKLAAGAEKVTSSGKDALGFAKDNWKAGLYAASPVIADQVVKSNMPQTVTSPASSPTAYIRPYTYNPYGQRYTAQAAVKPEDWGGRQFPTAASGGLMAMAGGGMAVGGDIPGTTNMFALAQQNEPVVRMAFGGFSDDFAHLADSAARAVGSIHPAMADAVATAQQPAQQFEQAPVSNQPSYVPETDFPRQELQRPVQDTDGFQNTGGSKQAYDYLMGKGDYPTKPYTPTGEIMRPYSEAVMGVPADPTQFATKWNADTQQYETNRNYKATNFDPKTGDISRIPSLDEIHNYVNSFGGSGVLSSVAGKVAAAGALPKYMNDNRLSREQVAAALGISVGELESQYGIGADWQSKLPENTTVNKPTNSVWENIANSLNSANNSLKKGASGGLMAMAQGGMSDAQYNLGSYSDGGRLLRGPGDGVSDDIPATIGKGQPARLADGEFVVPARIVSELGNGSTNAGARKLYAMMDRVQSNRKKSVGKDKVAVNSRADKYLPA